MSAFFKKNGLLLLVVFFILFFPIFWKLASSPLSIWDEARVGVNALEINGFKTAVAPYYEGKPDMFSLKPPLLPILQRICMEVVGYNVLGVRLPSALGTLGICMLFIGFGYRRCGSLWPGIISSLVITTTPGFVRDHVSRTGDYDALLAFFMTAYALFFFVYLENPHRRKYLYATALALLLAVLTKGVAALIPLPGLLIYTLARKKSSFVFQRREFYILAVLFILIVGAVYGLREYYTPGYLRSVFEGEFIAVPTTAVGGHPGPWWYYTEMTLVSGFGLFTGFMLLGLISGFVGSRRDAIFPYLLAYLGCYFLVISAAATKTPWYDAPFYPLASLAAGLLIYRVIVYLSGDRYTGYKNTLYISFCTIALFIFPYVHIVRYVAYPGASNWDMLLYHKYMDKIKREMPEIKEYSIVDRGYNPQALFFSEAYAKSGMNVLHKNSGMSMHPGETVLCCQHDAFDEIKRNYTYTILQDAKPCQLIRITGPADSLHTAPF